MRNFFKLLQRLRKRGQKPEEKKELPLEPSEILPPGESPQVPYPEASDALPGAESFGAGRLVELSAEEPSEALPGFDSPAELPAMEEPVALPEPATEAHAGGNIPAEREEQDNHNSLLGQLHRIFPGFPRSKGYSSNWEHLMDELWRIDQYIHAQILRWRETIAKHKPEKHWGMLRVTAEEIDAYLESDFSPAGDLHPSLESRMEKYW